MRSCSHYRVACDVYCVVSTGVLRLVGNLLSLATKSKRTMHRRGTENCLHRIRRLQKKKYAGVYVVGVAYGKRK